MVVRGLFAQIGIDPIHKAERGRLRAVHGVKVRRGLSSANLFKRFPGINHSLNAIPHGSNHDHILLERLIVGYRAMTGDDDSVLVDRRQRCLTKLNHSVDAATTADIDKWIA